jgi:hypothetical protein
MPHPDGAGGELENAVVALESQRLGRGASSIGGSGFGAMDARHVRIFQCLVHGNHTRLATIAATHNKGALRTTCVRWRAARPAVGGAATC